MAFDQLVPQTPIYPPEAETYAGEALKLSRAAAREMNLVADVPYGPHPAHKLDIYAPSGARAGSLPVLIFAHGGAWTHGYKEWMGLMAPPIVATPAIFVSIDYRLGPDFRFPDPVMDCIAALAWVRENIAPYGGNPERLFVGGHSAGAHLFALAVLREDLLREQGITPSHVKACLPVSGQMDMRFRTAPPGSGEEYIQSMFLRDLGDAEAASPRAYAEGCQVPMFLAVGSDDIPRIVKSNMAMVRALRRAGHTAELMVLQGYNHFDTTLEARRGDNRWVRRARKWLTRD